MLGLLLIGLSAGLAGSLLGLGGGLVIVPALTLLFDVPIHHAIAASLLGAIATSCGAAPSNLRRGFVNLRLSNIYELFTIVGAIVGGLLGASMAPAILSRLFGATLVLMSIVMFRRAAPASAPSADRGALSSRYFDEAEGREIEYAPVRVAGGSAISTSAGVLSGLLGIGGGIVQVPMMALLNRMPVKAATSTSNYMIGATAAAGAFVYYGAGFVDPLLASSIVAGVLVGSRAGAWLNRRISSESLRIAFAVAMVATGVRMLIE